MLNLKYAYHEDGECCHGHHHHEDGECCRGEGHGHPHGEGECCHGEGHSHGEGHCCRGEGHTHEHEHADGTRHCHEHTHTGDHCHEHTPAGGDVPASLSDEEKAALLAYMIRHNGHHLEELHALAGELDGQTRAFLNDAVELLAKSNENLVKAFYAFQAEQVRADADDRS